MTPFKTLLILAIASAAATSWAETSCFTGGHDSGELTFRSAVEGTRFSGLFGQFDVEYCMVDGQPEQGQITVVVETGSADTDNNDRDEALLGPEFFDVEQFPQSSWSSDSIQATDAGFTADGTLELRGISAPVAIDFQLSPDGSDQSLSVQGQFRMQGGAAINRQDFSVGTGEFADPEFVRNQVDVEFALTLSKSP